jgi:hypothetical protein
MGSSMEKNDTGVVRGKLGRHKVSLPDSLLDLIVLVQREPMTAKELARQTGLSVEFCRSILRRMHQRKMLYIADWEVVLNGRIKLPMYRFGQGRDLPRPPREPNTLVKRRWREKEKARQAFDPFFAMCR